MPRIFDELLERWITVPANRTLWKMSVGVMAAFAVTSPIWGSSIAAQLAKSSYFEMLPYGLAGNSIGLAVAALIMGTFMRRWTEAHMSPRRQVIAVVISSTAGITARFIVVVITFRYGYPRVGPTMVLTNLSISLSVILVASIVVLYAARREYAVENYYKEVLAGQAAIIREEEDVRGRIFDELHGTAHSTVLDIRRQLQRAASKSNGEELRTLDRQLADLYDNHIGRLARALYPSGLDVSLRSAVEELQMRHSGGIKIDFDMDPIAAALDNPISGGLHRDLRTALYRVIEECAVNAMRHAHAEEVRITVKASMENGNTHLLLTSFNKRETSSELRVGHGLTRLRQRIMVLGGHVAYAAEESSFLVTVSVPTARPG